MLRLRVRGQGDASALQRVLATITFMKKQLRTTRSVSQLAALAHLSPSRYSELFQQCVGSSTKEYWMRLRIHRAAQLLDTTNMPVNAVAREVGFADPLHFSRAFRKVHELGPKQYRARAVAAGASG